MTFLEKVRGKLQTALTKKSILVWSCHFLLCYICNIFF